MTKLPLMAETAPAIELAEAPPVRRGWSSGRRLAAAFLSAGAAMAVIGATYGEGPRTVSFVSTDNAYVKGDVTFISPKVPGYVTQVLTENETESRVLAAILPNAILEEYENVVRSAGYEPGAVMPSALAALASLDSMEPVLAACLSKVAITTSITHGNDLLLYRTLDLPEDPQLRLFEVQRSVAVAAAYYEDKISVLPKTLYFAGNGDAAEFEGWFGPSELTIVNLVKRPERGAMTGMGQLSIAGLTGALAGAI